VNTLRKISLFCLILEVVNSYDTSVVQSKLFINETFIFSAIKSSSIFGLEYSSAGTGREIVNYPRREVPLLSQPSHLNVNSDQSYLVVAIKRDGCAHALIYSVPSFVAKVSNINGK
jgi:hypothetical protein